MSVLIARRPPGLRQGLGSSFSSLAGVCGNRSRTRSLLGEDDRGGGLADGQAAAEPAGLGVVVDQHGAAVGVAGQAVRRQGEDVLGAPPGVDRDLDRGAGLGGLQAVQAGAQRGHDLRRQVASRLAAFGAGGDVAAADHEVAGQPGGWLPGPGQADRADPSQDGLHVLADHGAVASADRARRFQVGHPGQEGLDVGPAQAGRCHPVIAAGPQASGQPGKRVDLGLDLAGPAAAVAGQLARGPGLRWPGPATAG